MSWTVRTLESLSRDVTGLPDRVKQEALDWIDELAHDPFPDGCLKMRDTTIAIEFRLAAMRTELYTRSTPGSDS